MEIDYQGTDGGEEKQTLLDYFKIGKTEFPRRVQRKKESQGEGRMKLAHCLLQRNWRSVEDDDTKIGKKNT